MVMAAVEDRIHATKLVGERHGIMQQRLESKGEGNKRTSIVESRIKRSTGRSVCRVRVADVSVAMTGFIGGTGSGYGSAMDCTFPGPSGKAARRTPHGKGHLRILE
jgi:hypothetical protein